MKRILALSLSAALLLALLGGCSSAGGPETTLIPSDAGMESASVRPESTPSPEPTDAPSEEPTGEVSEAPSAEPSQEPSQAPATQAPATQAPAPTHHPEESHHVEPTHHPEETHHPEPSPTVPSGGIIIGPGGGNTQEPTDAPSKAPDGFANPTGPSASDVNLTDFSNTVLYSSGYGFPPMMEPPADFATNLYPGLFTIPVVQRIVSTPAMTGSAAELVLVQVANSSDVSAVKAILQARVDRQANDFNYPQVIDAWKNNSRIVSNGNYVMLIVHESCDAIVSQFNALF